MKLPDWSIATTCAEPRKVVEAFVAHHLSIGASKIFLFFDDPTDGLAHAFESVPGVYAVSCDALYWNKRRPHRGRPTSHRKRQSFNAEYAARSLCQTQWIAHIDADEFLHCRSSAGINELLNDVPVGIDAMRVLPAERMFDGHYHFGELTFKGVFKLKPPHFTGWGEELFGEIGSLYPNGFQGHEVGKSFKRCRNREARFNIHFIRKGKKSIPEHKVNQEDAVLLHFFPESYEDWKHKHERRVDYKSYFDSMPEKSKIRYGLYKTVRDHSGEQGIKGLFSNLCVLPESSKVRDLKPELFIQPDLNVERKVADRVKPFLTEVHFNHLSAKSEQPVPDHQRIFQIGMNRSGTKELCQMFEQHGYTYAHWDRGKLAIDLRLAIDNNGKPFEIYDKYNLISDMSLGSSGKDVYDGFYDFEYIAHHYPDSIFLLNHRPVEQWIASRKKFRKGKYLKEHMMALGLSSEQAVLESWANQWNEHVAKVQSAASNDRIRLIEYQLNTEKPHVFFAKLSEMAARS